MKIISDLWPSQGIAYTYITLSYQKDTVLDVHLLTQGLCSHNCDTCCQNPHHVDCINLYFQPQYSEGAYFNSHTFANTVGYQT